MKDSFQIRYLKTAERDLDDIFDYILRDNPTAAADLLDQFDKAISNLSQNPKMGVIP